MSEQILPSLYVNKVILESASDGYNKKLSDNPHISEETQHAAYYNYLTGKLVRYTTTGTKKPIYNTSSTNGNTKVSVTVIAKDSMEGKNKLPLWIDNDFIKQFIAINVVAVKSTKKTNQLLRHNIEKIVRGEVFDDLQQNIVRHYKIFLNETPNNTAGTGDKTPGKPRRTFGSAYESYDRTTRKNVYNVPYRIDFDIPKNQQNLTLVVFASVDLGGGTKGADGVGNALVNEFNINPANFDVIYNAPLVERVLVDGHPAGTTDRFATADDVPWFGPIHWIPPFTNEAGDTIPGRYSTGHKTTLKSVNLKKVRIRNHKVVDYRRIKRLTTPRSLDFTSTKNLASQLNSNLKMASHKPLTPAGNTSYVSKLYMTPSQSGGMVNNMFFMLDWRKLLQDNSLFPSLLNYPTKPAHADRVNEILKLSKIVSFSIFREKVVNESENPFAAMIDIDENHPPELIANTTEVSSTRALKTRLHTKKASSGNDAALAGSVTPTYIITPMGSVQELTDVSLIDMPATGVRYFTATDGSLGHLSAGKYQYSIKIRVINGTNQYLAGKLREIKNGIIKLRKYKAVASKGPGKGPGSWDPIYKTFSQAFKKRYVPQRWLWEKAIDSYLDCAEMLYQNSKDLYNTEKIRENFKKMCNPGSGSPKGIGIVLEIIEDFHLAASRVLGSPATLNKEGIGVNNSASTTSIQKPPSSKRVFEYECKFNNILDLNFTNRHTGYEYLGSRLPEASPLGNAWKGSPGLKEISRAEYSARAIWEVKKYIQTNTNENPAGLILHLQQGASSGTTLDYSGQLQIIENAHQYLTPSAVRFTGATSDLLSGLYKRGNSNYTLNQSDIIRLANTSVVSIMEHILAGSYSTKFDNNLVFQEDADGLKTALIDATNYLSLLEKYNCRIVAIDSHDFANYSLLSKPADPAVTLNTTFNDKYFYIDADGNEAVNPTYENQYSADDMEKLTITRQRNIDSSTGMKYDASSGMFYERAAEGRAAGLNKIAGFAANVVKRNLFSSHIDTQGDYFLEFSRDHREEPSRISKYLFSLGSDNQIQQYVKTLPLPMLMMLSEQHAGPLSIRNSLKNKILTIDADDQEVYPFYWMIYKNIVAVEAMVGLAGDTSTVIKNQGRDDEEAFNVHSMHVSKPLWASLTPSLMDRARAVGGGRLICRLRRYTNENFNVRETALTTQVPILNKYFILDVSNATA